MEITSAGVFYIVSTLESNEAKSTLLNILAYGYKEELTTDLVMKVTGLPLEEALKMVYRLQRIGYIRGVTSVREISFQHEDALTEMLGKLSSLRKAVLADGNGMYVASSGVTHESAEELAGFSVECINLYNKHSKLMKNNLRIGSSAIGLVSPAGRSEIGVWPIYIGHLQFSIIIEGLPRLQNVGFVDLIRLLYSKYQ